MSFNRFSSMAVLCTLCLGQLSFSSEIEVTPEILGDYTTTGGLGVGYHEQEVYFAGAPCVTGKATQSIVSRPSQPFANPSVKSVNGRVSITVSAVTSTKRLLSMDPPFRLITYTNPDKIAVCGNRFVAEIQVGARIAISRNFKVSQESESALIAILNTRVTDLRTLLNLDLSKEKLQLSGAGMGLSGHGTTKELTSKMGSCFWLGSGCAEFIKQAYADAESLDERFPPERVANLQFSAAPGIKVDFGDIVLYKMQSY